MIKWHNSRVTNESYISTFTWLMTTKLNKVIAYGIGHRTQGAWFFDIVIICCLMTSKKRNISSPMDTKLDRVVAFDMGPTLKKSLHS